MATFRGRPGAWLSRESARLTQRKTRCLNAAGPRASAVGAFIVLSRAAGDFLTLALVHPLFGGLVGDQTPPADCERLQAAVFYLTKDLRTRDMKRGCKAGNVKNLFFGHVSISLGHANLRVPHEILVPGRPETRGETFKALKGFLPLLGL